VVVEPLGRIPAIGPAGEVKHGDIAQADDHIPDIEVPVVVEGIVLEEVGPHVPVPERLARDDVVYQCVRINRDAVEQELVGLLCPVGDPRLIRVHATNSGEQGAIPDV